MGELLMGVMKLMGCAIKNSSTGPMPHSYSKLTQLMSLIHYKACPACGDDAVSLKLVARDYTVSQQRFPIWECRQCTLRFTQDVPDSSSIGDFYKSDNYISHSDTRKGLINSLYHLVRKQTLGAKSSLIKKFTGFSKGNLLDIGAGTGAFASHMQKKGWAVTALEPDETARAAALQNYNLALKPSQLLWDLPENSFHAISMWHVLEHVHELHRYLDNIKALLHEKGKLFIAVPNYTSDDADHYQEYWAAYDVPRHLYHFSPLSMKTLLQQHGLKLHDTKPMWFDSFYVSMLSEQYKNGNPKHTAAFLEGLRSNAKTISDTERCSSLIYIIEKENQKRTS